MCIRDRDVTEERMEQERQRIALEDAYQTAKVANEAKTNFLSSMSHDIRTPMNAIMAVSYTHLMRSKIKKVFMTPTDAKVNDLSLIHI